MSHMVLLWTSMIFTTFELPNQGYFTSFIIVDSNNNLLQSHTNTSIWQATTGHGHVNILSKTKVNVCMHRGTKISFRKGSFVNHCVWRCWFFYGKKIIRLCASIHAIYLVLRASPFTRKGRVWRLTCNFRVELEFAITHEMTSFDVWTSPAPCTGEDGLDSLVGQPLHEILVWWGWPARLGST